MFKNLGILRFDKLIDQAKLIFMHAMMYNYAPRTFDNTWIRNNERGTGHTLRNDDDYLLPHPRVEFFKKIPIYSLAATWNASGVILPE
jgi:hypothetical protein